MTDAEKLTRLKALIGTTSLTDDTLSVYLEMAAEKVLRKCYPYATDTQGYTVPTRYENIQVDLAVNAVLKRGADGLTNFSDNGQTRSYMSDDELLKRILPYAHVPGVVAEVSS